MNYELMTMMTQESFQLSVFSFQFFRTEKISFRMYNKINVLIMFLIICKQLS